MKRKVIIILLLILIIPCLYFINTSPFFMKLFGSSVLTKEGKLPQLYMRQLQEKLGNLTLSADKSGIVKDSHYHIRQIWKDKEDTKYHVFSDFKISFFSTSLKRLIVEKYASGCNIVKHGENCKLEEKILLGDGSERIQDIIKGP